jgi:hypothetical protein
VLKVCKFQFLCVRLRKPKKQVRNHCTDPNESVKLLNNILRPQKCDRKGHWNKGFFSFHLENVIFSLLVFCYVKLSRNGEIFVNPNRFFIFLGKGYPAKFEIAKIKLMFKFLHKTLWNLVWFENHLQFCPLKILSVYYTSVSQPFGLQVPAEGKVLNCGPGQRNLQNFCCCNVLMYAFLPLNTKEM